MLKIPFWMVMWFWDAFSHLLSIDCLKIELCNCLVFAFPMVRLQIIVAALVIMLLRDFRSEKTI